jgi:glucose-1-phosphate adenylyltransferase
MANSLIRHLGRSWHLGGYDEFIEVAPAQMRRGKHWYRGTADSVCQNLNLIADHPTPHVAVFGGDHIYKCAVDRMEDFHIGVGADLTVAAFPVPRSEAHQFGVIEVDGSGRIVGFQEKPEEPTALPGQPETCLVSMGSYFFRREVLTRALLEDADDPNSRHDFGGDVIPKLLASGAALFVYDFSTNRVPGEPPGAPPYWRDVGTIDSYISASMELRSPIPTLNLYNREWRIRTAQRSHPPVRFAGGGPSRLEDSMVCEGSVIFRAEVGSSIVGFDCTVRSGAHLDRSLLMSGCEIGEGAQLSGVLTDKNCVVADGARIGCDSDSDRRRFPFITEGGVIVLPKGTYVPVSGPIELARDIGEAFQADAVMREALGRVPLPPVVADRSRHSFRSAGPGSRVDP